MANKLTHKQSSVAGKAPTTTQLELGELAINTTDGKLFLKKNVLGTESVVEVGADNAGTATKLATPRTLTIGSTGKAFDGSSDLTWTLAEIGATGATNLQYLTEVRNITAPNTSRLVQGVQVKGTEVHIDLLLEAKGAGATVAQVPNGTVAGGNKRGMNATDWQKSRQYATQVASGNYASIGGGSGNTADVDYAAVGGGAYNTASGSYAYVGGGDYNTVDGSSASVVGGSSNTVYGSSASVVGGSSNTVYGSSAFIGGGGNNTANGNYTAIGGGYQNTASGENSTIPGGKYATTNGIQGLLSYGFAGGTLGQNQMSFFGGRADTANGTPTRLTANAGAASASNQLTLRNNSVFRVRGTVVSRNTSTNDAKEWTFEALIKRGASASATAIVGTPTITSTFADTAAASRAIAISADTTNGALAITGTGAASTSIRWTAVVHSIEVA